MKSVKKVCPICGQRRSIRRGRSGPFKCRGCGFEEYTRFWPNVPVEFVPKPEAKAKKKEP